MHTHILEQIATLESQIDPGHPNNSAKRIIQSKLSKLFEPSLRRYSGIENYIYFLEPDIENIMAVIKKIPPSAEVVVLNSDVGHLGQICDYLDQPTRFKTVFIIRTNEIGKLQCWNIDTERADYIDSNRFMSDFSRWTMVADHLSYDCAVLRGECHMEETGAKMSAVLGKKALNSNAPLHPAHSNNQQ